MQRGLGQARSRHAWSSLALSTPSLPSPSDTPYQPLSSLSSQPCRSTSRHPPSGCRTRHPVRRTLALLPRPSSAFESSPQQPCRRIGPVALGDRRTDICPSPGLSGQRSQDPTNLLQGKGVPKAHPPQGPFDLSRELPNPSSNLSLTCPLTYGLPPFRVSY